MDSLGVLWQSIRDPQKPLDLAFIRALRKLAARYIQLHADDDEVGGGISFETVCSAEGYRDAQHYCEQVILPLGVEAEGIVLNAVARCLHICLRVAFMDRQSSDIAFCDYGCEAAPATHAGQPSSRPLIHVQLRPGHYDLLYVRADNSMPAFLSARGAPVSIAPVPSAATLVTAETLPKSMSDTDSRPPTFGRTDGNAWSLLATPPPAELEAAVNASVAAECNAAQRRFEEEREALEREALGDWEGPSEHHQPPPQSTLGMVAGACKGFTARGNRDFIQTL